MSRSHTNYNQKVSQGSSVATDDPRTGKHSRVLRFAVASALSLGALQLVSAGRVEAQGMMQPTPPQIGVNARGEVQVTPDRAKVQVGVETEAKTAAAAAEENNRKQTAILSAIRALGIDKSKITTLNYNVSPMQRYDEKERRVVIDGYRVSNIVQVIADKIEQAGPVIDAALKNGGNRVAGLDFEVKDESEPRNRAIALAVESAKQQAEAAAKAAGGQLGELLELTINEFERPRPPMPMMAMSKSSEDTATPISEGMSTVAVNVQTRWRFEKR